MTCIYMNPAAKCCAGEKHHELLQRIHVEGGYVSAKIVQLHGPSREHFMSQAVKCSWGGKAVQKCERIPTNAEVGCGVPMQCRGMGTESLSTHAPVLSAHMHLYSRPSTWAPTPLLAEEGRGSAMTTITTRAA